jgi:pyrroloquinoline quinone (PQQ) biosynthesis protein C
MAKNNLPSNLSFSVESVQQELKDPLGQPEPGPELLGRVLSEAYSLAHEAYELKNPSAKAFTERLLFTIHANNSFAPPLQGISAILWSIFMRAKLRTTLTPYLNNGARNAQEMKKQLEKAVREADAEDHPWIDEVTSAPDLRGVIIYTKNWFGSTHGFAQQLLSLCQRCREKIQIVVLENVAEEFGVIEHEALRQRFVERIGGSRFDPQRALDDPDQMTESFSLANYRTGISTLKNPSFALGSFYSIEAIFPPVCRRLLVNLRKRGFDEYSLESFSLHIEKDEDHAAEWMKILEESSLSPEDRERVVAGALAQLHLRHEMFNAMRTYFAKVATTA